MQHLRYNSDYVKTNAAVSQICACLPVKSAHICFCPSALLAVVMSLHSTDQRYVIY